MTYQRLAARNVAAGEDLGAVDSVAQWTCDGCGVTSSAPGVLTSVNGQVNRLGVPGWINAELCGPCLASKPVGELVKP